MTDYEVIKGRIRDELEGYRVQLQTELARVEEALRTFVTDNDQPFAPTAVKTKRKRMSAAARAAVSARMKKYWANRRKKAVK